MCTPLCDTRPESVSVIDMLHGELAENWEASSGLPKLRLETSLVHMFGSLGDGNRH